MQRGLRGEPLTIYGDGHQTRDFVFVGDVAAAVFEAAQSAETGVYNVGTGQPVEVLELANTIVKLTGGTASHRFEALRPGDVRSSTADVTRIEKTLGWRPAHSPEQGLRDTLEWYRQR
jgi:UDP-glucose 4-epimerase